VQEKREILKNRRYYIFDMVRKRKKIHILVTVELPLLKNQKEK